MVTLEQNREVWKFGLPVGDEVSIEMPIGATILSIGVQYGAPQIWALVDPALPTERRVFYVLGTGHKVRDRQLGRFVGTFMLSDGRLVFHVFEKSASVAMVMD